MCSYVIYFAYTTEEENLTAQSIIIGRTEEIFDRQKDAKAASTLGGIPYSVVGNEPDSICKDQMSRLKEGIASHFEVTHRNLKKLAR